jgi:transposase
MKACLARFGVRGFDPTLRKAADRLEKLITPEGVRLPPLTLAEMLRDMARLRFVGEQIRWIEKARVMRLKDDATRR